MNMFVDVHWSDFVWFILSLSDFFIFILSCDSSSSGNKLHSTLLPHYPGKHPQGPALTQQPGGGVSGSDGRWPVVAHRGKLGAHDPVSANVAEGVHVALPCRHRQWNRSRGRVLLDLLTSYTWERWRVDKDEEWQWQGRVYAREENGSSCLGQSFEKAPSMQEG